MATNSAVSQVSIDDILEYTSNNGDLSPEEQAAVQAEEIPPAGPPQPVPTPQVGPAAPIPPYHGQHPNTSLSAIPKESLAVQSSNRFVPLPPPTAAMLAAAHMPEISERIPQDHPEWHRLRSGKVTGSSLAEFLGLFEDKAGAALSSVGVHPAMRDPAKLKHKVLSLQQEAFTSAEVDPITQVFFDWGHKHEPNGILSYLMAEPDSVVHEVGFVLLDPSLATLPAEVRQGIQPAQLPVIGSSPDGIILQGAQSRASHAHWREAPPSARTVLEIKAKTAFRPLKTGSDLWCWLGRKCLPHQKILPQYFAQAQLNMLVTGAEACHLLSHTVRQGSAIFVIPLHKQWCNQMLHWVAQLNILYVVPGLEPPANVFRDQPEYRRFVQLTKEACRGLMNSARQVPSCNSRAGQEPLWLRQLAEQPSPVQGSMLQQGPEVMMQAAPLEQPPLQQPSMQQPQQQKQHLHQQQSVAQQSVLQASELPGVPSLAYWQDVVPDTQDQQQQQQQAQSQQLKGQYQDSMSQQQQQQQQQQRPPQHGQWQQLYQASRAGQQAGQQQAEPQHTHADRQVTNGMGLPSTPLRDTVTAAAAVALPDDDEPMPDANPDAATGRKADTAAADPTATENGAQVQGPIGFQGLHSYLRRMLHKHKINLMETLDHTCQAALSLLAKADVCSVLERIARDIRAGWPNNPSALCMQRIKAFVPGSHPVPANGPAPISPDRAADNHPAAASPALTRPFPTGPAVTSPATPAVDRMGTTDLAHSNRAYLTIAAARPKANSPAAISPALATPVRTANGPVFNSPIKPAATSPGVVYQHNAQAQAQGGHGSTCTGTLPDQFTSRQVANLSDRVRQQLYLLLSHHQQFVRASDFDMHIVDKLASMTEVQALNVLQQLDGVHWAGIQNNTKYIMFFCCYRA